MSAYKAFMVRFGLKVPIIQAPMANVSTAKLALEVALHGGLGLIPMSPIDLTLEPDKVFSQISTFREAAGRDSIVNCNFFCFDPAEQHPTTAAERSSWCKLYLAASGCKLEDVEQTLGNEVPRAVISFTEFEKEQPEKCVAFINKLADARVGVVSFHFGVPSAQAIRMLQDKGIAVFACATSVREAKLLSQLKVDAIVLQGYEAGGHRGNFLTPSRLDENLSTSALFEQVKAAVVDHPFLIPSGGIVTSSSVNQYLENGAAAVQLGTIFIPTQESAAPDFIAKSIENKSGIPTIMTALMTGRAARMLQTPFVQELVLHHAATNNSLPLFGYSTSAIRKVGKGDKKYAYFLAGQNYHLVKVDTTVKDVMTDLATGLQKLHAK